MRKRSGIKFAVMTIAVLMAAALSSVAQDKTEIFQATAHGQGNQAGMAIAVTVTITSYSTPEDRADLWKAFTDGGNPALVNALVTLPSRGHVSFTGVEEYEVVYARELRDSNGRKIRVVAKRPLRLGENPSPGTTSEFRLSALEFDLSKTAGSGTGSFLPACELAVNDQKEIEVVTYQSPWRLDSVQSSK